MQQIKTIAALVFVIAIFLQACARPAGIRYPLIPTLDDGALHVINFNVGQADAMLVIYKGKSLLIDCGSPLEKPGLASQRLPRRLDALLGSRHIDYFLVTHYHADHVGGPGRKSGKRRPAGIFSLIDRDGITIGTLLDRGDWLLGTKTATHTHYQKAVRRWLREGVVHRHQVVRPGDSVDLGEGLEVDITVTSTNGLLDRINALFPSFLRKNPPSENDYSVGAKITLGKFEMFAAGDLSGENVVRHYGPISQSYTDVESYIANEVGSVEVYRVDHHGSQHSSNPCFTQVLHPTVSIISSGADNRYGHPHPDVYWRLKRYGDVFITDGVGKALRDKVSVDVVGDDVEVLVSPSGARYWVNGAEYSSLSDAEENLRPNARPHCYPEGPQSIAKSDYRYRSGNLPAD